MFESVMRCSWKDLIRGSKLFYESEALKLRSVYDPYAHRRKLNVSMDWIIENLRNDNQMITLTQFRLRSYEF